MRQAIKTTLTLFMLTLIFVSIISMLVNCGHDYKDDCRIIEYHIRSGDTLIGLYGEYAPDDTYIYDWLSDVMDLNEMNTTTIYAGDTIKLYTKK